MDVQEELNGVLHWISLLLILFYKWLYTTSPQSHVFLECSMITWPCHMIQLPKFPCYLYLNFVVWLDIMDQVFEYVGIYFLFVALIIHYLWASLFLSISLPYILFSFSKLSTMNWNSWMPPILLFWKQQNIMESSIWRAILANPFKSSSCCP